MKRFSLFLLVAALMICGCNGIENGNGDDPVNGEVQRTGVNPFTEPVEGNVTLPQGNDAYPNIQLTKAEQGVSTQEKNFGIEMFKDIVKDKNYAQNVVFSPFSLSLALSLTASGACGETLSEMTAALGFKGFTSQEVGSYYDKLLKAISSVDSNTLLESANAVWSQYDLRKEYVTEASQYYDAKVERTDFSGDPTGSQKKINAWAKEKTHGMIEKILEQPDSDLRVALTNALYFKAKWSYGPYYSTSAEPFTDIDSTVSSCRFFKVENFASIRNLPSYFGKDASVIKIPYGNSSFSMVFALPGEGVDYRDFVSYLTAERWEQWLSHMSSDKVYFKIPVFEDACDMKNLVPALQARGMNRPFSPLAADFSKMCDKQLYINMVIQKAKVKVDNEGTEAAAVTLIGMKDGSAGPGEEPVIRYFIADRPFIYAIVENSHNTLLFLGQHVVASK